jgi:uncharacterized protein (TIGR03000 family)
MFHPIASCLRSLTIPTVLLAASAAPALADHHGGGGSDHGGGYNHGAPYYHHDYHHGYGGFGVYVYPYWGTYYGWAYPPFYPGIYPDPVPDYYAVPNGPPPPPPPGPSMAPASIVVQVPTDARVWFDDTPTQAGGASRTFETPPLAPDKVFHYTVRARWTENGETVERTQRVDFQAGRQSLVDFLR